MSDPLLKLIAAQRLLAETRGILERDERESALRQQAEARASVVRAAENAGPSRQVAWLDTLLKEGCRFGTIYADPPWQYENRASRGAAENHYPTMSVQAIAELPVAELAAAEAHLHLWTTNGFLFEAQRVIEAWGFNYKSCLIWIKPQLGNGNYWRVSHEYLLLGTRGNLTFADRTQQSWIFADRTVHSAKPPVFRKLVEQTSPAPRLELFARTQSQGWTSWGNQFQPDLFEHLPNDSEPNSTARAAMTIEEQDNLIQRLERIEQTLQLLVEQRTVKEWYSTAEIAKLLGKAEFTVREWCRLGRVNAQKRKCGRGVNSEWIISHEELNRIRNEGLLPESHPYRHVK